MATADDYAKWIVTNADKKGTPEFETVTQAYQAAKQDTVSANEIPAERRPPATMAVVTSAPYKALGGAADVLLNAPQNVINLAKMGVGTLANAAGYPNLAPEVTAPPERVTNMLRSAGLIKPTENMTPAQKVWDVALQSATGGMLSPARTGAELLRSGGLGLISGATGQGVAEATDSPIAGVLASMAAPTALAVRNQMRQPAQMAAQQRNAERDATIRAAQKEGFLVTPGSVSPSTQNVLLERIGGKQRTEQTAASHNQDVADKLARRAVDLPPNESLTSEKMQAIRNQEFTKGYAPLEKIGPVAADNTYLTNLADIENKYLGASRSFPGTVSDSSNQAIRKMVDDHLVSSFDSKHALQEIRALRDQASKNFTAKETGLAKAQIDVANALEAQIERQLIASNTPNAKDMLAQFRASREKMAKAHNIEEAIVEGGGSINPQTLAAMLQRGEKLTGDLAIIARFANIAKPVMKRPGSMGTPAAGSMLGTGAGLAGAGAGIAGAPLMGVDPVTGFLLGTAVTMTPEAMRAAARKYLLSKAGQNRALPGYGANAPMSPALRNALIGLPVAQESQNALAPNQ